jgi:hypothetical protein
VTRLAGLLQAAPLAELEALVTLAARLDTPNERLTANGRATN